MSETTLEKISRLSGIKQISCACEACKDACRTCPCIGTPEDIDRLVTAGHANRLRLVLWGACTFFTENGLCELHDKGLKPTEGRLSNHNGQEWNPETFLTLLVAKEWLRPDLKLTPRHLEIYLSFVQTMADLKVTGVKLPSLSTQKTR
jgi:hypothetical protein